MEISAGAPALVQPVKSTERLQTLDVLRGFALFGIMFVNVHAFVNPTAWFDVDWESLNSLNYGIEVFKLAFTQGKFYTLFAFLFGLGFAVQLGRAEAKGAGFAGRFFWRVLILFAIGILHIVYIWDGDILNTYAVGGMFLLLFFGIKRGIEKLIRKASKGKREKLPRWTVIAFAAFLIFGPLMAFAAFVNYAMDIRARAEAGETLTEDEQPIWEQIQRGSDPEKKAERERENAAELAIYESGSYLDTVSLRIENLPNRVISGPFWFMIAGIFTLGAFFGRYNFIGRAAELRSGFRQLMIWSFVLFVPLTTLFAWVGVNGGDMRQLSWMPWLNFFSKTASGLAFALFAVAAITLLMLGPAQRWLQHLAPVGRMALSNYLAQSVLGSIIFYGYGFGLIGKLDSLQQLGYIVVVFGLQMVISRWWLERFRFGPMEWLWRSLTYRTRQPFRK